ncbi:MAG: FGGY-family carbohydrate kinase [Anaerolineae bacterium]
MRLIGLDIGTTGCKAVVFEEDGTLVTRATREYSVAMPQPGWAEQDAEAVWRLAQDALREVLAQVSGDLTCHEGIGAIGLSVQGEAVMPVDAEGRALRPAILGMDTRTTAQNEAIRDSLGAEALFERTGMPVHTINTLPKLLWLKEHEPEVWDAADRFLLYEDFLISKMTGLPVISECLASRTQLYDLGARRWAPSILAFLDLAPERLSTVRPSGYAVGRMLPDLAADLGFAGSPVVVTGGHDQACGALGVALTEPGLAMVSTGTAEVVEVALDAAALEVEQGRDALTSALYEGNISVYAHTVPDLYLVMTLNHSGGLLLRWFRDTFGQIEMARAEASDEDAYDLLLAGASPDPTSLLVLPHFAGSGTPTFDTASRGATLGLTFSTTKTEMAKALLEGLTFELRLNLDLLRKGGVAIEEMRAIGGGARSDLWLQLKADITGVRVVAPRVTEAACWGAALLAGAGAGAFADVAEAAANSLDLARRFVPDADRTARYEERYRLYQELYPTVKGLLHRL